MVAVGGGWWLVGGGRWAVVGGWWLVAMGPVVGARPIYKRYPTGRWGL